MMSLQVKEWMTLYKINPELKMYENLLVKNTEERIEEVIVGDNIRSTLNPIDVVLESLMNVLTESISIKEITTSQDTTYITKSLREHAKNIIIDFLKEGKENKLKELHESWINEVLNYLNMLYREQGNIAINEVLYRVSDKFRISGESAIKATISVANFNF